MTWRTATVSALLAVGAPGSASFAAAQQFTTTFVVRQGGTEAGRETLTLRPGRERGLPGSTLLVDARYAAAKLTLNGELQRMEDGQLALFRLRADGPEGTVSVLAAGAGAHLVVRTEEKGTESGREMPGGRNVVLLDEQVHALFQPVADLATPAGVRLTAVYPRTGRRAALTARRVEANRVELTGDVTGTLHLDANGRLERLELPASSTVVTRLEG